MARRLSAKPTKKVYHKSCKTYPGATCRTRKTLVPPNKTQPRNSRSRASSSDSQLNFAARRSTIEVPVLRGAPYQGHSRTWRANKPIVVRTTKANGFNKKKFKTCHRCS